MKYAIVSLCTVVGMCAFAVDAIYDSLYTAETGYVVLDGKDQGSGGKSSFHTAGYWSDKQAPHSGTNYYVKTGSILCLDHDSSQGGFEGDSLVVAGRVKMSGAWGSAANCDELTMLPDSEFEWCTVGNTIRGSVNVMGTGTSAVKPVLFLSGRGATETTLYSIYALMKFSSGADAELHWCLYSGKEVGVSISVLDDWSEFLGTFRIGRNLIVKPQTGSCRVPGNLIVSGNAMLDLAAKEGCSEIGSLTVLSNGVLNLSAANGTHMVKIAKKLEIEPGALVIPQSFSGTYLPAVEFHPVFELAPEAVAEGLPDFSSIPVAFCGRKQSLKDGHEPVMTIFPELNWVVRDNEAVQGGKIVGFACKEVVSLKQDMLWGRNGFVENGTGDLAPAQYWTDGKYPQKGKCYYNDGKNLFFQYGDGAYVFPGDSLMVNNGLVGCYSTGSDVTIDNLILGGNARFRLMTQGATYHLRGKITVVNNTVPSFTFNGGDKCTQYVESDISGSGLLRFTMNTEVTDSWNKTLTCGTCELTGDNSAFHGKIVVDCWQAVPDKYAEFYEVPYRPGPCSNITLRVSNQSNLGGAMPSFVYDSLTVSNECRLSLLSTSEFADLTRGWFFPENAYLRVEEDAVATVKNPITYGRKLVKEGLGKLMLGGTVAVAPGVTGRPQLKVEEGSLGFVSSAAVDGLDVCFAAGALLRLQAEPEDDELAVKGIDLTNADIASESTIGIEVDMSGVDMLAAGKIAIPVCTVPESRMPDYEGLFTVGKIASGCSSKLAWVSNPDFTKTLCLTVSRIGFLVRIR